VSSCFWLFLHVARAGLSRSYVKEDELTWKQMNDNDVKVVTFSEVGFCRLYCETYIGSLDFVFVGFLL
jgi:hypothetical protein